MAKRLTKITREIGRGLLIACKNMSEKKKANIKKGNISLFEYLFSISANTSNRSEANVAAPSFAPKNIFLKNVKGIKNEWNKKSLSEKRSLKVEYRAQWKS